MSETIDLLNQIGERWWPLAFHATWQSALVAAVILLLLWAGRRWPSPLRYGLALIALVKFVMPPFLALPMGVLSQVSSGLALPVTQPAVVATDADWAAVPIARHRTERLLLDDDLSRNGLDGAMSAGEGPPGETHATAATGVRETGAGPGVFGDFSPLGWRACLMLLHGLGALVVAGWILRQYLFVARLARRATPITSGRFREAFGEAARALRLRRSVQLRVCPDPITPMSFGVLRPVVLISAAMVERLSPDEQRAILAHELAHHRRGDMWANWFQAVVVSVCWFNPLAWLVSRAILRLREDCCDDLLLHDHVTTGNRYCQALVRAVEWCSTRATLRNTAWFAPRMHPLGERINRAMDATLRHSSRLSWLGLLILLVTACMVLPGVTTQTTAAIENGGAEADSDTEAGIMQEQTRSNHDGHDLYGDPLPQGAVTRLGTVRFRQEGEVKSVQYSPDGTLLASTYGSSVVLWDAATGKPVRRLRVKAGATFARRVAQIAFSPDGQELAARCGDAKVRIWEISTGAELRSFPLRTDPVAPPGLVKGFAYSPDGTRLAISWLGSVTIRDTTTGKEVQKLGSRKDRRAGLGVAWTPDGKYVVIGGMNPTAHLWDATTGRFVREFQDRENTFAISVTVSPDGKTVAVGSKVSRVGECLVYLWELGTGTLTGKLQADGMRDVKEVAFAPDGKTLVVTSEEGKIRVWDIEAYQGSGASRADLVESHRLRRTIDGRLFIARSAALSPDGKTVALGAVYPTIRQWDVATGRQKHTQFEGHDAEVLCVAYSPDGRVIASGGENRQIRLWDAKTGRQRLRLDPSASAHVLAFDSAGKRLATAWRNNGVAHVWDVASGNEVLVLDGGERRVRQLGFTGDGRLLVTIGCNSRAFWHSPIDTETIHVWDAQSGKHLREFKFDTASTESMTISPNDTSVILGSAIGVLQVRDLETGKQVAVLSGHNSAINSPINSLVCSRDGRTLASGSRDGTIRLWDTTTWKTIGALEGHGDNAVKSVAFSPDGRRLASCCAGRCIRLWDVASRTQIGQFRGHDSNCSSLCFSPDGKRLVSGLMNTTILVWDATAAKP